MRSFILFTFLFINIPLFSQEGDTLSREKFLTMVYLNQDESYMTITQGIARNVEPLWFEARLSPNYFFKKRNRRWALSLNPQVQMRMLQKFSMPVLPPSFRLHINYYRGIDFWKSNFLSRVFYEDAFYYFSLGHHSNGQSGNFYLDSTETIVNTENGNFATNFVRFGVSSYSVIQHNSSLSAIRELNTYVEIHPKSVTAEELKGSYGFYRWFVAFGFAGPAKHKEDRKLNAFLHRSRINIKTGWIFGEMEVEAFEIDDRLIVDVEYEYSPTFFDEVAFFARFYRGQDYYNIRYINNITQLTIGITTNIISQKQASNRLFEN